MEKLNALIIYLSFYHVQVSVNLHHCKPAATIQTAYNSNSNNNSNNNNNSNFNINSNSSNINVYGRQCDAVRLSPSDTHLCLSTFEILVHIHTHTDTRIVVGQPQARQNECGFNCDCSIVENHSHISMQLTWQCPSVCGESVVCVCDTCGSPSVCACVCVCVCKSVSVSVCVCVCGCDE